MAHYPVRCEWPDAILRAMSKVATEVMTLTPGERDYIRRELDIFFSTYPTVAEGFQLKTGRGGSQAGHPKLPPPARSLLDRGLMRLDTGSRPPRSPSRRCCEVRPHQARTRHRSCLKCAKQIRRGPSPARFA